MRGGKLVTDKKIDFLKFFDEDGKTWNYFAVVGEITFWKRSEFDASNDVETIQLILTNLQPKVRADSMKSFYICCFDNPLQTRSDKIDNKILDNSDEQTKVKYFLKISSVERKSEFFLQCRLRHPHSHTHTLTHTHIHTNTHTNALTRNI